MAEETPPVEGQAPAAAPAASTVPPSLVSADGSLVDNWQQHAPEGFEDLKDDKTLSTMKNVWNLSKSYVHVRKQVPMDKMPRPNENWGDNDWEEFYKAGGCPETPKDYNIKRHPDIPEDFMPQEVIDGYQELLHKHGASQKLVDALAEYNNDLTLKQITANTKAEEEHNTRLWDQLHDEWGRAYDQKVFRAEKAIERGANGDEGYYQAVLAEVNKSANLIKLMSRIEDHFSEHSPVESVSIPTPADFQEQIDTLMKDPVLSNPRSTPAERKKVMDKIMRLREEKSKT